MADFEDRLYKELQTVEEFRFKFSIAKIAFVSGLLGIGAMKLTGLHLTRAFYLAPLVAVFFDMLGMGATVAIYRIDAFLRVSGEQDSGQFSEKSWQTFLKGHRSPFSWWAATGFTALTFLASLYVLGLIACPSFLMSWRCAAKIAWFTVIGALWGVFRWWEYEIKKDLDSIDDIGPRCTYNLRWLAGRAKSFLIPRFEK